MTGNTARRTGVGWTIVLAMIATMVLLQGGAAQAQVAQTVTVQVGASADDSNATASGATTSYTAKFNTVNANTLNSKRVGSGFRFTNVAIPAGASITSATLQLYASNSNAANLVMDSTIYGQAADNPGNFTTLARLYNQTDRPRTAARASWTGTFTFGTRNNSPDLTGIVQEVVNRPGWASGNSMVLLALGDKATAAKALSAAFDQVAVNSAKLVITFTEATPPQTVFTDVTDSAGVSYLQSGGIVEPCAFDPDCRPEMMAGGAAAGDVDGDGDIDLFVTRRDNTDILFCNQLADGGGAVFSDCSAAAGLNAFNVKSNGAAFGDIDNDGDLDLAVNTIGESRRYLFINNGSGVFTESAVARGVADDTGAHSGWGITFGDYDRDGYLDMFAAEWRPDSETGQTTEPHAKLYRNRGASQPGFFDDVTLAAGVSMYWTQPCTFDPGVELCGEWAFAPAITDLDGDGWPDLVVAADFGHSRIFWNDGDGTFTDGTDAAGVGTEDNGMGSTFGDYDNDGDLDWFVTSIYVDGVLGKSGNRLFQNNGNRTFTDATDTAGVRNGFFGWGAAFLDYDNDGDLDLTHTNGVPDDPWKLDPMRFWQNNGPGTMPEMSATVGLTDLEQGKGLLVFDYDNDGDMDIFVPHNRNTPVLYRNDGGNAQDWLRVETVGTGSNAQGIGALVTVETTVGGGTQIREIGSVTHFNGHSDTAAHFGLGQGSASIATVTVEWPSGITQTFTNVTRNTTLTAVEPAS